MHSSTQGSSWKNKPAAIKFRIYFGLAVLGTVALCAALAPFFAPTAPDFVDLTLRLLPPGAGHPLGCDINGSDILTSLLYGARTSLYVGVLTVVLSLTLGVSIGLVSGYKGGWIDQLFMRTVELLMAFPGILLAMAIAAVLGPSVHNVVIAITATGWTSSARIMRGQVLSIRERDFVSAIKALGAGDVRILTRHILPSAWSPLVVHGTFSLSGVILVEASLSFLGLGAQGASPTWGALLNQGRTVLTEAPHVALAPGIALMLLILALNFLGDALRDLLDPRYRS